MQSNELNFYLREDADQDLLKLYDDEVPWQLFKGDLFDLLVSLKVFASKSQARKNWKGPMLSPGFNLLERVGKYRYSIAIYAPCDIMNKSVEIRK